jgi:hypothetical protein
MVEADRGRLVCPVGGADFSPTMRIWLTDIVTDNPTLSERSTSRRGGSWYCPADRTLMAESDGRVACPSCGRNLPGNVMYQLIEVHAPTM